MKVASLQHKPSGALRGTVLTGPVQVQEAAHKPDPLAQAIAEVVAADPEAYIDRLNFQSEICISCDWRRLELSPKVPALHAHGLWVSQIHAGMRMQTAVTTAD